MTDSYSQEDFLFEQPEPPQLPALSLNEERWAQLIFIDPLSILPKLSTASTFRDNVNDHELVALYADWQSRDSEVGYALVERRKRELQAAIECYRSAIDRRYRTVSFARARLQTIQRINATEPNVSLHYPDETIYWLESEIQLAEAESQYLRLYTSRMYALATILQAMNSTGQSEKVEQYCRLIGQAWRGQMKVRAFQNKFPYAVQEIPTEGVESIISGEVINNVAQESPFRTDIILTHTTVAYLRHQLKAIAALAEKARTIFESRLQASALEGEWPPIMVLLAAIVELFYYCNFEIGYGSQGRVIEQIDIAKVWNFDSETKDWQQFSETAVDQLRRQATEAAMLLTEFPPFLRCSSVEDVSHACQAALVRLTPTALTQAYGPYQFAGLARMERRGDSRSYKFQNAVALTGSVLAHVVSLDVELSRAFNTACGGPIQTLINMANLDARAFGLSRGEDSLTRPLALKVLANFWKRMGKQRPVALLGEGYAKNIYAGLASIGESAPERSSLLSIHLTNILGNTILGQPGQGPPDLLTVLMLADQIRLMDLLELSWSYAQAVINDVQAVRSLSEIGELIRSGGTFARFEPEIAKRFNQKWITATQPLWTILRGAAPHAWGFWAKLSTGNSVAQLLGNADPSQSLGFLLMPLADIARLMLLFETSSPVLAERQKVDSETAARDLLAGFIIFRQWPAPLGTFILENLSYYFDPAVQHDAWLAFTESLKEHLRQLDVDLHTRNANQEILDMLATMRTRLDANYPSPQRTQATAIPVATKEEEQVQLPDCELAETDCLFLQTLCKDLIGDRGLGHVMFLKALGLWRDRSLHEHMRKISEYRKPLRETLVDAHMRATLLGSSTAVREVGYRLAGLSNTNTIDIGTMTAIGECLSRQRDFHRQLEALLAMSTLPFDEDRQQIYELSVKTSGERAELLMLALSSAPCFVAVNETGPAAALARYKMEMKTRVTRQFPNWQPEPLLLGAVTLCASRAGLALTNSRLEVDPIFQEPNKPNSARMLWTFASNKLGLALKLLQAELTDSIVAIRL
ncbi:MAG: hypothetical protein AB1489_18385 [Acidobacteriota bacterium]